MKTLLCALVLAAVLVATFAFPGYYGYGGYGRDNNRDGVNDFYDRDLNGKLDGRDYGYGFGYGYGYPGYKNRGYYKNGYYY